MSQKWQKANIKQYLLCALPGVRLQGHLSISPIDQDQEEASLSLQTTRASTMYRNPITLSTLFNHCFSQLVT